MKQVFLFILIASLLCSCGKKGTPLTASEVESKYGSAIVLVKNEYFYSIDLGGQSIYFTGIDDDGDLENMVTDIDKVEPAVSFGTGFFISEDGKIATNSHVASPPINEKAVRKNLSNLINILIAAYTEEINSLSDKINELHNYWLRTPSGSALEAQIEARREEVKAERDEDQNILNQFRMMDTSRANITTHTNIGIAQNDTHITNTSDFVDCVTLKDDSQHDLAVLQIKNKRLPEGCAIIDVNKYDKDDDNAPYDAEGEYIDVDTPVLGDNLFLLGFNLGPALAITEDGIKAQITEGAISQNTDDTKVMYTIPTLHGSSGAPVLDKYGNLMCINFAGLDITQNFNYGVKAKHLRSLLNK